MTQADDFAGCAALVARADPDRFLATMAAPASARSKLFALYALNIEVSRAPWVSQEPMIAEMRLQWWRDALEEIATGAQPRRHDVVTPLSQVLDADGAAALDDFVALRRWDIYCDAFEDDAHFERYIDGTSGSLLWQAARSLGPADEEVVRNLGYASGLASWFCAIPDLEARGRIPLIDGSEKAIVRLAQTGLDRLARARARRKQVSRAASPALLAGWQAGPILAQAARTPRAVAAGALALSPAGKRLRLMARAASGVW